LGDGIGVADDAEGAPHHRPEKPYKEKSGQRIVMQVGEELPLEGINDKDADEPRDRRRLGREERTQALLLDAYRLGGSALVHEVPVSPGRLEHEPEEWKPVFREDHAQTKPSHHASGPWVRRNYHGGVLPRAYVGGSRGRLFRCREALSPKPLVAPLFLISP
jgi:hypothetical protein